MEQQRRGRRKEAEGSAQEKYAAAASWVHRSARGAVKRLRESYIALT